MPPISKAEKLLLEQVAGFSDVELKKKCTEYSLKIGPLTATTRKGYEKTLVKKLLEAGITDVLNGDDKELHPPGAASCSFACQTTDSSDDALDDLNEEELRKSVEDMADEELKAKLEEQGIVVPRITDITRQVYQKKLVLKLMKKQDDSLNVSRSPAIRGKRRISGVPTPRKEVARPPYGEEQPAAQTKLKRPASADLSPEPPKRKRIEPVEKKSSSHLEEKLKNMHEEMAGMTDDMKKLEGENMQYRSELELLSTRTAVLSKENEQLRAERSTLQEMLTEKEKLHNTEKMALERERNDLKKESTSLRQRIENLTRSYNELNEAHENMAGELKRTKELLKSKEYKLERLFRLFEEIRQ